jgi:membrane protease YdiL (CAAX protease family)
MAVPALTAAILLLAEHRSFRPLFAPFAKRINGKSIAFTFVYPLVIILLCAALALVTKQGTLSVNWVAELSQVPLLILLSIPSFFLGLLEEYGWRGYLLPRWTEQYGLPSATWRVGIIWAAYHLPAILLINLQFGLWNALIFTFIQVSTIFLFNFGFSYLYKLSQNVILPSIMHILWNNVNVKVLGDSYRGTSNGIILGNVHIINGECLFGLIVTALFAVLLWNRLRKPSMQISK